MSQISDTEPMLDRLRGIRENGRKAVEDALAPSGGRGPYAPQEDALRSSVALVIGELEAEIKKMQAAVAALRAIR